jgi:hypothetical protein
VYQIIDQKKLFEKKYDGRKLLPGAFTVDSYNKNLYLLNFGEDGVMYKESIP